MVIDFQIWLSGCDLVSCLLQCSSDADYEGNPLVFVVYCEGNRYIVASDMFC